MFQLTEMVINMARITFISLDILIIEQYLALFRSSSDISMIHWIDHFCIYLNTYY